MTNKIIPNNSLYEIQSAKSRSPTIINIQPLSLRSPPILNKKVCHIPTNFPTNPPEQQSQPQYPPVMTAIIVN